MCTHTTCVYIALLLQQQQQVTYDIIVNSDADPTSLDRIRYRICALSNDIILMEEILVRTHYNTLHLAACVMMCALLILLPWYQEQAAALL
jgi:hypothetical protein